MRILVTGGDGMLGSILVRLLIEQKHDVSVFTHPSSKSGTLDGLSVTKFIGCVLQPGEVDHAVKGHDAIIHAAAVTDVWPARSEKVRKINIEGTKNVISAALKNGIKRFVYIGSGSSVNAKDAPGSRYPFPGAKYGLDYIDSKYYALQLVMEAAKNDGLPAIAVLPSYMIGPYDSVPGSGRMIQTLASGKLKFYTDGGRNFVYSKDVAVAVANSLTKGQTGKYYIAGNENLTYKEFFSKVAAVVGVREPVVRVPGWTVKAIGFISDTIAAVSHKPPLLSYPMARISCDRQYVSSEDAVRELHMPQTKIEEAIKECYSWFIDNGYIKSKKNYVPHPET